MSEDKLEQPIVKVPRRQRQKGKEKTQKPHCQMVTRAAQRAEEGCLADAEADF
jgi:hypothetical protein